MLEKFKRSIDQGKVFDVLLTDVSKVFGCSPHELIIAWKASVFGAFLVRIQSKC